MLSQQCGVKISSEHLRIETGTLVTYGTATLLQTPRGPVPILAHKSEPPDSESGGEQLGHTPGTNDRGAVTLTI
jgi:hypothetical protein